MLLMFLKSCYNLIIICLCLNFFLIFCMNNRFWSCKNVWMILLNIGSIIVVIGWNGNIGMSICVVMKMC